MKISRKQTRSHTKFLLITLKTALRAFNHFRGKYKLGKPSTAKKTNKNYNSQKALHTARALLYHNDVMSGYVFGSNRELN